MKIYHTETQVDYDALMVELEERGYTWLSGRKPTEAKYHWFNYEEKTCVRVYFGILTKFDFRHSKEEYPNIPITKYKVEADDKMRFTKENVERIFDKFMQGGDSLTDLKGQILNLSETPEKVVVPKFVADVFSSELHFEYEIQESRNIPHVLSTAFGEVSSNKNIKFLQWVKQYPDKYVMAVKYGYEVEKEPRYEVIIAGRNLLKLFHGRIDHEFAEKTELCAWAKAAYQLTEQEIKAIDERYIPFMIPVGDEHENNE